MFYVFVRGGRAPRVIHPSEDSAIAEAKRLHALLQKPAYAVRLIEAVGETEPIPLSRYAETSKGARDGLV